MTKEEASNQINDMKIELAEHLLKKDIEALDIAISALKGGWIPITEGMELPEHDVICCDNDGDIDIGYLYFDEDSRLKSLSPLILW